MVETVEATFSGVLNVSFGEGIILTILQPAMLDEVNSSLNRW